MPKKIMVIVGARPQFVKAAVVSRAIANEPSLEELIVHTGQHFDDNMSKVFFEQMGIPQPAHHLSIGGGTHGQNTGRMIEAVEKIILADKPDAVLVYGDTDSTLAGAIAAAKINVPLAHVEAGLRSFNRRMPEEVNRILTDHASDLLFAPSQTAVKNLSYEGVASSKVRLVGDVMFDAVQAFTAIAKQQSSIVRDLKLEPGNFALATLHRQENTDDVVRLEAILAGLAQSPFQVIIPLHPRTRKRMEDYGIKLPETLRVIEPVGYLDMMALEASAGVIATDSGGVQKEAYFHGVPCITLRDETEWMELVEVGANVLVGANTAAIKEALGRIQEMGQLETTNIYGDGTASSQIARVLAEFVA